MQCKNCGSTENEKDDSRGETICMGCGSILLDNLMVESLSFMENSNGSLSMCGQFISNNAAKYSGSGGRSGGGFPEIYGTRETREQTLQKGYNHISKIAGRSARLTHLCTSVRTLGQVFMKLIRLLHLQVPHIDPSLFMERFASQMELGNKTLTVAATGVRLIQAMTRDWISTGRRPTGLCGSALLISARYHGFKMNAEDLAHIVRISSPTLMKRLSEFRMTSTAQLTAEQFEVTDLTTLPILNGPPALYNSYNKVKKLLALQNDSSKNVAVIEDAASSEGFSNSAASSLSPPLSFTNSSSNAPRSSDSVSLHAPQLGSTIHLPGVTTDQICNENPSSKDISNLADRLMSAIGDQLHKRKEVLLATDTADDYHVASGSADAIDKNSSQMEGILDDLLGKVHETDLSETYEMSPDVANNTLNDDDDDNSDNDDSNMDDSCDKNDVNLAGSGSGESSSAQDDTNMLLSLLDSANESSVLSNAVSEVTDNDERGGREEGIVAEDANEDEAAVVEESLSDVEDISYMLLSEKDKNNKTLIWDELTKDIMPEVHRKLKERRKKANDVANTAKRSKLNRKDPLSFPEAASAAESVRMALERSAKSIANRLNEGVLESLFCSGGMASGDESTRETNGGNIDNICNLINIEDIESSVNMQKNNEQVDSNAFMQGFL